MPNFQIESQFEGVIGGIDEAGRGPWAGPVVAAAAIFQDPSSLSSFLLRGLQDSKKLSKAKRDTFYESLKSLKNFYYGIGLATVEEIDQLNILKATFLAMERATYALPQTPHVLLIDGKYIPSFQGIETRPIIGGDGLSLSIAAASILAKVTRDQLMEKLAEDFPLYGWEKNAGYGTAFHQAALQAHGITPHHRKSFKPIQKLLDPQKELFS